MPSGSSPKIEKPFPKWERLFCLDSFYTAKFTAYMADWMAKASVSSHVRKLQRSSPAGSCGAGLSSSMALIFIKSAMLISCFPFSMWVRLLLSMSCFSQNADNDKSPFEFKATQRSFRLAMVRLYWAEAFMLLLWVTLPQVQIPCQARVCRAVSGKKSVLNRRFFRPDFLAPRPLPLNAYRPTSKNCES